MKYQSPQWGAIVAAGYAALPKNISIPAMGGNRLVRATYATFDDINPRNGGAIAQAARSFARGTVSIPAMGGAIESDL